MQQQLFLLKNPVQKINTNYKIPNKYYQHTGTCLNISFQVWTDLFNILELKAISNYITRSVLNYNCY